MWETRWLFLAKSENMVSNTRLFLQMRKAFIENDTHSRHSIYRSKVKCPRWVRFNVKSTKQSIHELLRTSRYRCWRLFSNNFSYSSNILNRETSFFVCQSFFYPWENQFIGIFSPTFAFSTLSNNYFHHKNYDMLFFCNILFLKLYHYRNKFQ